MTETKWCRLCFRLRTVGSRHATTDLGRVRVGEKPLARQTVEHGAQHGGILDRQRDARPQAADGPCLEPCVPVLRGTA